MQTGRWVLTSLSTWALSHFLHITPYSPTPRWILYCGFRQQFPHSFPCRVSVNHLLSIGCWDEAIFIITSSASSTGGRVGLANPSQSLTHSMVQLVPTSQRAKTALCSQMPRMMLCSTLWVPSLHVSVTPLQSLRLLQEFQQMPHHLTQDPPLLSLDDLLGIRRGSLVAQAKALLRKALAHVDQCEVSPTSTSDTCH